MTATAEKLVRKQIMLSPNNIEKLEQISNVRGTSAAEIVRLSIDSYNPDSMDIEESELMGLVCEKLKDAIQETSKTRRRLNKTLKRLELKEVK
ncbi:MAG: hypothetical protein GY808_14395 [Gammaproteobacteria bacterium]|nr:hypothetical protein [Gammaproteobacteria bacterium]